MLFLAREARFDIEHKKGMIGNQGKGDTIIASIEVWQAAKSEESTKTYVLTRNSTEPEA